MDVLLKDGEVRNINSLELLGHYFKVDQVMYWIPIDAEFGKDRVNKLITKIRKLWQNRK